jgi:uncharacterized SAM-binding protein YcdF (DUF218 family)
MIFKKNKNSNFSPARKYITLFFLLLFTASLVLAYIQIKNRAGFNIGTWFPPLYFFLLLIITDNLHKIKRILKKFSKPFIFVFYFGMSAVCILFITFCAWVIGYPANEIPDDPDLVIVLGCQVVGYEPGVLLRHRLDTAVVTLNEYPGAMCVVSGGQGPDEIIPEAQAMRQYLINNNILEARILEEDKSSNTFQNLVFSKQIIEQNNIYDNHSNHIIILTSEYHIPRAVMLAERIFDGAQIYAVQSKTPFVLFSAGLTREFFALVKSFVFDRE